MKEKTNYKKDEFKVVIQIISHIKSSELLINFSYYQMFLVTNNSMRMDYVFPLLD